MKAVPNCLRFSQCNIGYGIYVQFLNTKKKSLTGPHTAKALMSNFNLSYYFYHEYNGPDQSDPTTFHASLVLYKQTLPTVFRGN